MVKRVFNVTSIFPETDILIPGDDLTTMKVSIMGGKSRFRGGGGENALIRDVSGAEIQADWYRPTLFIRIS